MNLISDPMLTAAYDYALPPELIAQHPAPERDLARMMVMERDGGGRRHLRFDRICDFLKTGDLVVMNDTKVFPARLFGTWLDSAGRLELLLLERVDDVECDDKCQKWECLCRSGRPVRVGQRAIFPGGMEASILSGASDEGTLTIELRATEPIVELIEEHGRMPLPPYIIRQPGENAPEDAERYQTVYAKTVGAVAAPTAGLHFTPGIIAELHKRGVETATLTLHVGLGTFRPVKVENIGDHEMHSERYIVTDEAANAIRSCRERGGRILAVGSTTVRTLETMAREHGQAVACAGRSDLFIHEPYSFRLTDMILTNFHLPRSTLLMMMAAFVGRENMLAAYEEAVSLKYRFFSYGDCMLISQTDRRDI